MPAHKSLIGGVKLKLLVKPIFILGLIIFLLGLTINLSYPQTKEIVIDPEEVIGKYVTGDPEEYLDIKKDGIFYLKEKGKYYSIVGAPETTGKWEIEKDKIIFFHPLGIVTRGKIEPNVIIDEEGKIWFKEGSIPQTKEIVIDPEEVVGKYVTDDPKEYLDIKKDGTFYSKEKDEYYYEMSGKWEIGKDEIILTEYIGLRERWKIGPNVLIDPEGKTWFKEGSIPQSINEVTKESEESPQTKVDLVAALQELKDAMLFKIDADIENTALSFSLVKDYWRIKRWADLARAPLRVLQGTLSLLAKASDWSSFNESIKGAFDHSESIAEFIGVGMMIHGLREAGEKLYFAVKGPPYVESVEAMLKEADTIQLPLSRFDKDQYKKVIVNRLYGPENSPLTILRKTPTPPESAPEVLNGALQVRKVIISTYNQLISQIVDTLLPENFPLNETIVHIKRLRSEIANSTIKTIKIKYLLAQENIKKEAEVDLGVPGSFHSAFSLASGNLDQDLRAQQTIEWLNLAGTAGNIIQISLTYEVPGKEAIKIVQQVDTLGEIILNGRKLFQKDLEEDFYMLPQAMLHSLPAELSNLLRISDGTVNYLHNILNTLLQPIKPPEEPPTPVTPHAKPLMATNYCEYWILNASRSSSRREGWDDYTFTIAIKNVSSNFLLSPSVTPSIYAHYSQHEAFDPKKTIEEQEIRSLTENQNRVPVNMGRALNCRYPYITPFLHYGLLLPRYTIIYKDIITAPTAAPKIDFYMLIAGLNPQRIPIEGPFPSIPVFPPKSRDELSLGESFVTKTWQFTPLDFETIQPTELSPPLKEVIQKLKGEDVTQYDFDKIQLRLWVNIKNLGPRDASPNADEQERLYFQLVGEDGYSYRIYPQEGRETIPPFMEETMPFTTEDKDFEKGKNYALLAGTYHPDKGGLVAYNIYRFEAQPPSGSPIINIDKVEEIWSSPPVYRTGKRLPADVGGIRFTVKNSGSAPAYIKEVKLKTKLTTLTGDMMQSWYKEEEEFDLRVDVDEKRELTIKINKYGWGPSFKCPEGAPLDIEIIGPDGKVMASYSRASKMP